METHNHPMGSKSPENLQTNTPRLPDTLQLTLKLRIALIVASSLLMPLCFEPFGYWPMIVVTIPMLLAATIHATSRQAFYLGLMHGIISYGIALFWLYNIFSQAAIGLFLLLGVFTALFCMFNNYFDGQFKSITTKIAVTATLWTAIEFFRCELFFLRFAWITPGTSLGPTALSPIVGVYGTSFVIVIAAACWLNRKTMPLAVWLGLLIIGLGIIKPGKVELGENAGFKAAIIQSESSMLNKYTELTNSVASDKPELVVWPEYALPYDVRQDKPSFNRLLQMCGEMNTTLVTGTKTTINEDEGTWYNTALTMDSTGTLGEYFKARPVHFFNDGVPGKKFEPAKTSLGHVGTSVCFDGDFTAIIRRLTVNGAQFFAIPSYDAESWSLTQHLQHSALFKIRAAENHRWIAYAASSGISQIIDPYGNVHASIEAMTEGAATAQMAKNSQITFFTKAGWIFPWITLGITACLLLSAGIKLYKDKKNI